MLVPHVEKNGTPYMTIGLEIMHLNCNLSYLNLIDIYTYESYILEKQKKEFTLVKLEELQKVKLELIHMHEY